MADDFHFDLPDQLGLPTLHEVRRLNQRPDPTIVTRDATGFVPSACIVILGFLLLLVVVLYG